MDSAIAERFLHEQIEVIAAFARELRTCRTHDDLTALVERHLRAAFVPERAGVRADRIEVLGRCRTEPELATVVAAASREASQVLAEALEVARTRGWVRADANLQVVATWILGQVTSRVLMELDSLHTHDELDAWDQMCIDGVLAVLGCARPAGPRRRRWGGRTRS